MANKSNKGLQPLANKHQPLAKTAMVAPPPSKLDETLSLEEVLFMFGNDRAYTVLSHKGHTWVVHFEGDAEHKTIKYEDGDWVIK